ncbi:MAG: sugar transferase [Cetobacterium sp.]
MVLIPITILVWFKTEKEEREKGIFFTQNRIGANGETIKIYKYRSMVTGADEILKKILAEDPEKCEEYRKNKKLKDDPRITKIGEFLRRTSLDEFPQFLNVIKGQMSFVGPRPYLFREIEDMGKAYDKIINLKPGITGMWQAHGRSDTDFEERLVLDEYYYRNWTLWLDIIIVIKTIKNVVAKEGAH